MRIVLATLVVMSFSICAIDALAAERVDKTLVAEGDWSEAVNGLRGRMLFYQGRLLGDSKIRESLVYVELESSSQRLLHVYFDPEMLACSLKDARGNAIYYGTMVTYEGIGEIAGPSAGTPDFYWDQSLKDNWPPGDWGLPRVHITLWETNL